MSTTRNLPHFGGGRKGLFLLLRYVFIISASYLVIFENPSGRISPAQALMLAMALASNLAVSRISSTKLFSWYVEAPILIADTLWVSWALNTTGTIGQEFFLLYFFVLFLAATGRNLAMVVLGAVMVSVANIYLVSNGAAWNSHYLLRIAFFMTVAMFYSHVLKEIQHERRRADEGFAWARDLEAQVAVRTAELRLLYETASAASTAKSELVANMSHELRTPLNIISGYAEMLSDRHTAEHDEDSAQIARRIRNAADTLRGLVDSVLDLGKLESGEMPVTIQPLSLAGLTADLMRRERMPVASHVTLNWDVPEDLPEIATDREKLTIVLDNLINNAIKFTRQGTITVRIRNRAERNEIELQVADTGDGIDQEHLIAIFHPFHQVDGSSTKRHDGVGLGLAIVASYLGLLGGRVHVESSLGRGSTFTVTIPHVATVRAGARDGTEQRPASALAIAS